MPSGIKQFMNFVEILLFAWSVHLAHLDVVMAMAPLIITSLKYARACRRPSFIYFYCRSLVFMYGA